MYLSPKPISTEGVTDIDTQRKMIIFESFMTTCHGSVIFEVTGAKSKIVSSRRTPNHRNQRQIVQIRET